jgi:hypothetical protein
MKKLHLLKRTLLLLALIVGCVNYGWAAEVTYKLTIDVSSFNTTSYAANNTEKTTNAVCTTDNTKKYEVTWKSNQVMNQSSTMQWQSNKGYIYNITDLGTITNVTVTSSAGSFTTYYGTTEQPSSGTAGSGKGFFKTSVGNATGKSSKVEITFVINEAPSATLESIRVKTASKTKYKVGETPDFTGLVLEAVYDNEETMDVTSGYTASPNASTPLTTDDTFIRFTWNEKTVDMPITVGTLSSLSYNSGTFANITYTEKDFFDPTGLVVTAHYSNSDGLEEVIDDYTLTPSTETALSTTNDKVVVSYTWAETEQTVNIPITVNAGTKYTVTYNGGAGTPAKSSDTETEYKGGVTLPSATIELDGWTFAGWAAASQTSTQNRPILYLAGETYYPTDNVTLYAVYSLDGIDGTKYQRVTELSEATSASNIIIVNNSKAIDDELGSVDAPSETDGLITPTNNIVWSLDGDTSNGFTLTTTSLEINSTLGIATIPSSSGNVSLNASNNKWIIEEHTGGDNLFVLKNKTNPSDNSKVGVLEYTSNRWKYYCVASSTYKTTNNYSKSKLYVPVKTAYNSNPDVAIIQPTVDFEKGNTTLYLDGTTTYTNAASVTGVDKSVTGYRSSNESVATVDASGVVTAVGIGTATITAYLDAELGVHKAAQATYNVVVKTTTTIAGLKTIDNSTGVAFAADLTDAVVTYVAGNYAYIQDASAAILVNKSEHGLVAGQKINGAVSGTVKITNSIDQLTAIDLSAATVTEDGAIPTALTKTVAEVSANAASLDGQLVTINAVTVDKPSTTTTLKDGSKIEEVDATITMYSPNSGASVNDKEKGNFTGFVSLYNGNTPRINLYEQSQFVKTHNAPTAQTLSFEGGDEAFDEVTSALSAFTGKSVEGAHTAVTYSKVDASSIIGDFNTETGALTLNGACGTATITASAAAGEVVEAGVTTPYLAASESYTITVSPRYMITFSVNGVETVLRQATSGAAIAVPTPTTCGDYTFVGWSTSTVAPTDDEPSMTALGATVTPEDNDDKYYAVFAQESEGGEEEVTSTLNLKQTEPSQPQVINGVSWSWSNVTFTTGNAGMLKSKNATVTFTLPVSALNAKKIQLNCPAMDWGGTAAVVLKAGSTELASMQKDGSYTFTSSDNKEGTYTMSQTASANAWINSFTLTYAIIGTENFDYRTSLPTVEVTITDAQYATFCYARELNVTGTGVTAYTASANGEGEAVTLTKISDNIIPANTGVILFAESAGNYAINVSETGKEAIAGNELVGVTTRTQIPETSADKYNYIFSKKDDVIGFYRASGAYLLPNRAYLSTSTKGDAAAREFMAIMFDEGETTSLREVRGLKSEVRGEFFNLNGQRVATPVKGNIYIVNGKKVMFK